MRIVPCLESLAIKDVETGCHGSPSFPQGVHGNRAELSLFLGFLEQHLGDVGGYGGGFGHYFDFAHDLTGGLGNAIVNNGTIVEGCLKCLPFHEFHIDLDTNAGSEVLEFCGLAHSKNGDHGNHLTAAIFTEPATGEPDGHLNVRMDARTWSIHRNGARLSVIVGIEGEVEGARATGFGLFEAMDRPFFAINLKQLVIFFGWEPDSEEGGHHETTGTIPDGGEGCGREDDCG